MIVWYDPFLKPFKNYLADFSCFLVPPNSAMLFLAKRFSVKGVCGWEGSVVFEGLPELIYN